MIYSVKSVSNALVRSEYIYVEYMYSLLPMACNNVETEDNNNAKFRHLGKAINFGETTQTLFPRDT